MSEKRMFLNPLITAQSSMTINVGYTWVYPFVKQHAHRLGLGDPWAHLVWECAVGLPTVLSFMRLRGPLQEKDEVQILSSQWQNSKPWNYHLPSSINKESYQLYPSFWGASSQKLYYGLSSCWFWNASRCCCPYCRCYSMVVAVMILIIALKQD